jgi:hephaestin
MLRRLTVVLMFAVVTFLVKSVAQATQPDSAPKVRTYYVAADEVEWDYAPGGINKMMGMKFEGNSKVFTERGPHRIGTVYRKALYREYTDATFTKLKPRAPEWEHAGILGPILRAEVDDTISVVFKNNATHPFSMHPHGVFYDKSSEEALYEDGTSGADKADDAVPPGGTYTYTWKVPERAVFRNWNCRLEAPQFGRALRRGSYSKRNHSTEADEERRDDVDRFVTFPANRRWLGPANARANALR